MIFTIYTDGGCSGNKRDSGCKGACAFTILDAGLNEISSGSAAFENTTNNRMELQAVIFGMDHLLNESKAIGISDPLKYIECVIISDSKYVVDNYNDYIEDWKKNNWKKTSGGPVINSDLWKEISKLSVNFKSFKLEWVKGHSTNKFNQKVDEMVRNHLYPS